MILHIGNHSFFMVNPTGAFSFPESYMFIYIETVSLEFSQVTL